MTLPAPSIVIFDMDGTTVRHINPKLLGLLEWLDDTSFKINKFCAKFKKQKEPKKPKRPRLIVHRTIHKLRRKPVEQLVEPCPGIYSVLKLLRENNIPMAIASNGLGHGYGHDILKQFGLDKYFSAHVFREDISRSKPHPEAILKALERLEYNDQEDHVIWYIGDRHKDVIAAWDANDHIKGRVIPIAYAPNAAFAIVEKGLGLEHIMMNYDDMYEALKKVI